MNHAPTYLLLGLFTAFGCSGQEISSVLKGRVDRTINNALPHTQFTVGALVGAHNHSGVDQWAFGVATEAWAKPGSLSILVGIESAVINEEPNNKYPKIASNAVMKNRADGKPAPALPMNAGSIAYWVTAQPGTWFETGVSFAPKSVGVAIDVSALESSVPIMKFNDGCMLYYKAKQLEVVCP